MKNILLTLIFLHLLVFGFGQNLAEELKYEVNKIYPSVSITKQELREAQTLMDLNERYPADWVKEYMSVEILTTHQGKQKKTVHKNDNLTQQQHGMMNTADAGTEIGIKVHYMPNNTLSYNEVQEISFLVNIAPDNEAKYVGGLPALQKYLKENAIDKTPAGSFEGYDMAVVKFAVNQSGAIINAQIFETSKDEKIDELLLETIRNMPSWLPAQYTDGTKIEQEFAFTIGNMENCNIHRLNIRREIK